MSNLREECEGKIRMNCEEALQRLGRAALLSWVNLPSKTASC